MNTPYYGQSNYPKIIQGINGKYTIKEIGCFLTAQCNVAKGLGHDVAPQNLNKYFITKGVYIDIDDGIRDDLSWNSITSFDPTIVVAQVGNGGNVPNNPNAIVRITSNNKFGTHFCKVHKVIGGKVYIVDSWDGYIKLASAYGSVTGWAVYKRNKPTTPAPKPTPAQVKPQPVTPVPPTAVAPPPDPSFVVTQSGFRKLADFLFGWLKDFFAKNK